MIATGGGAKGVVMPDDWMSKLSAFTGADRINMLYAMSEVSAMNRMCEHGHYHLSATAIPFVLDPDTGKPLPRAGTVTGRMAFLDLCASSRWGGVVTGDEVTIHWDGECPCGQTSHYLENKIERFSESRGGDDKITCAATPAAHAEAMDFLSQY
jgi:hypothetical protein